MTSKKCTTLVTPQAEIFFFKIGNVFFKIGNVFFKITENELSDPKRPEN